MKHTEAADPYAQALLEAARANRTESKTRKELEQVHEWIQSSEDFVSFLENPSIGIDERKAVVSALAKRALFSGLTTNFLQLLADKRRLAIVEAIIIRFTELLDEADGIVRAEVISAKELSAVQVNRVKSALKRMTGKKVEISTAVDDSLIGGLVVKMEGKIYDNSVKNHLSTLRENVRRL